MDMLIRYTMYILLFVSVGIMVYISLQPRFIHIQNSFDRIRDRNEYQKFLQETRYFLERSIGQNSLLAAYTFLLSLLAVFIVSLVAFTTSGNNLINAFLYSASILVGVLVIFYALAYRNQVLITHEGLSLLEELINNYKINHNNILETIDRTSENLSEVDSPLSKRMMRNLSLRIKHARNDEMVQDALNQLVNTIAVSWAYSLSSVFEKAIVDGIDVSNALTDIKKQLEDLEQLKESLKDEVHEAKTMLMYLVPMMALLTLGVVTFLFEIPIPQYIKYQFGEGATYLFAILILLVLSIGYYLFITKPKNDY